MEQSNQSGSKYLREIRGAVGNKIDVYAVLLAFDVRCPARQHAIKKLLCSGLRGRCRDDEECEKITIIEDRAQTVRERMLIAVRNRWEVINDQ